MEHKKKLKTKAEAIRLHVSNIDQTGHMHSKTARFLPKGGEKSLHHQEVDAAQMAKESEAE